MTLGFDLSVHLCWKPNIEYKFDVLYFQLYVSMTASKWIQLLDPLKALPCSRGCCQPQLRGKKPRFGFLLFWVCWRSDYFGKVDQQTLISLSYFTSALMTSKLSRSIQGIHIFQNKFCNFQASIAIGKSRWGLSQSVLCWRSFEPEARWVTNRTLNKSKSF